MATHLVRATARNDADCKQGLSGISPKRPCPADDKNNGGIFRSPQIVPGRSCTQDSEHSIDKPAIIPRISSTRSIVSVFMPQIPARYTNADYPATSVS
jgi:hypothetical protein